MPARDVPTPTFCVTLPVPATAPLTTSESVELSISVSVPVPWTTPVKLVFVRVASSLTAPVSATATGASFTAVTVMVAVSVADEKALVPPTVLITAYVPALPPAVLSQAPKVTLVVPFQLPAGTKRRLSVASSSSPLPALSVKLTAVQLPAPSLYCHMP